MDPIIVLSEVTNLLLTLFLVILAFWFYHETKTHYSKSLWVYFIVGLGVLIASDIYFVYQGLVSVESSLRNTFRTGFVSLLIIIFMFKYHIHTRSSEIIKSHVARYKSKNSKKFKKVINK
ncbi:MAG: hypothetical protein ACMXX6_00885 [Candidatus Woesearchaeota archaeon]